MILFNFIGKWKTELNVEEIAGIRLMADSVILSSSNERNSIIIRKIRIYITINLIRVLPYSFLVSISLNIFIETSKQTKLYYTITWFSFIMIFRMHKFAFMKTAMHMHFMLQTGKSQRQYNRFQILLYAFGIETCGNGGTKANWKWRIQQRIQIKKNIVVV